MSRCRWAQALKESKETLLFINKYREFYAKDTFNFFTTDYVKSYNLLQELKYEIKSQRKKRDVVYETLEAAKHTLRIKFEQMGQKVPWIVNTCCKDLKSQYRLFEENIGILTKHLELEEQIFKDLQCIISRRQISVKLDGCQAIAALIENIPDMKIKRKIVVHFWMQHNNL